MIYVIDAPALLGIELVAGAQAIPIFNELHDLVLAKTVVFCDETLGHLERLANGDACFMWAKGAISDSFDRGAHYGHVVTVIHKCPTIVDPLAKPSAESAAAHVIAQALALSEGGKDVMVVTADRAEKPTRASVKEGCRCVGIESIGVEEFLAELGLIDDDESTSGVATEDEEDWDDDDWGDEAEHEDPDDEDEVDDEDEDDVAVLDPLHLRPVDPVEFPKF